MMGMLALSAKRVLTKIAVSLISDNFLEWALFKVAGRIVKSTATPHDDEWLAKIKESYEESK